MNKFINNLKHSLLIILGGLIVPALLSIIFSGFRINIVSIVSFQFFVGIIIAMVGGVMISFNYNEFRKKVLKTSMDVNVNEEDDPKKVNWSNVLFYSGLIIVLAAIGLGEIL